MKPTPLFLTTLLLASCAMTPDELDPGSPAAGYLMEMDGNFIISMVGAPRQAAGNKSEIVARAQSCAARTLTYTAVTASGTSNVLFGPSNQNISADAGQLVEAYDPANGLLVANTRVNYVSALIPYSAQARVTVEAKDGRFRIVLGRPQQLQRDTGYASTDTFRPVVRVFGTNWSAAIEHLAASANKLGACIEAPPQDW